MTIRRWGKRAIILAVARRCVGVLCIASILVASVGCGKSEQQKRDEQAAEDARWEAAVEAANQERADQEKQLTEGELKRMAAKNAKPSIDGPSAAERYLANAQKTNPAFLPSGIAVARPGVTKQNMDDAVAAVEETSRLASLDRVKKQELLGWEKFLGMQSAPAFRDAHWNTTQTAICGEVDFLWIPPDGGTWSRTGFHKFVLGNMTHQTIAYGKKGSTVDFFVGIDIDHRFRVFGQHYDEIMAVTDCSPDYDH